LKEIERKFLVDTRFSEEIVHGEKFIIRQGYLKRSKECTVRVRIKNDTGFLTIKGSSQNFTRDEFEYEIPRNEAEQLLELCGSLVLDKIRYELKFEGKIWEVDQFLGKLDGFWLAEIELNDENENFERPEWLGREVSLEAKFTNSNLVSVSSVQELMGD
jgi:adenylate cyclase